MLHNNNKYNKQEQTTIHYEETISLESLEDEVNEIQNNDIYFGWINCDVEIKNQPNIDAEIIDVIKFNTYIEYSIIDNSEWVKIKYNNAEGYIDSQYVSNQMYDYIEYTVPNNNGFKSYMSYTSITSKTSDQYILQTNYAYTGKYGIRQINNRYCIAIGTAFNANVGTYLDLILENGVVIPCIIGDIKSDVHTLQDNITTASNGCVSEFIVDIPALKEETRIRGDISSCKSEWDSPVIVIKIYEKYVFNK